MTSLPPLVKFNSGVEHTRESLRRASGYTATTLAPGDIETQMTISVPRREQKKLLEGLRAALSIRAAPALAGRRSKPLEGPILVRANACRETSTDFSLVVPRELDIVRATVAPFLSEVLGAAGLRPRLLSVLDFELWPNLRSWRQRRDDLWESCSYRRANAHIAALQDLWRSRLPTYLALDAAAGSGRNPALIATLHTELAPLEYVIAWHLIAQNDGAKAGAVFLCQSGFYPFGLVPAAEMFSAGGALMAAGWIEDFALFDASMNLFAARRGRELRKLSNSDLLALVVP